MLRGKRSGPETPFGNGSHRHWDSYYAPPPTPRPDYGAGRTCPECQYTLLHWEPTCPVCGKLAYTPVV